MSTHPRRRYTLEEYFALELASEEKYEYFDGEVYAMSGGSRDHEQIIGNLLVSLRTELRGRSCRVYPSNLRVKVPSQPPYRYPDLTALCDVPLFEKIGGVDALINPTLIVEVLSPTTEAYDRGDKFTHYKSIESFDEYLLVAQHRPHITHYVRGESGVWSYEEVNDLESSLLVSTLGCRLELRDVYTDVEFPPSPLPPMERP
ncbi:MAG TPA: Uma2 family endonuclease [Pyrinomonadaceae bacterium]|nr:Uma2 family endonuclease [Pyrinomonadaceae bacterium]